MTSPAPSALERCVGDAKAFLETAWARRPLHHRSTGSFSDLMSMQDVDRIITSMSLRLPAFRLVKEGQTIPPSRYTRSGRTGSRPVTGIADPVRILELFAGGATIVLQGMHRFWLPLARFCRDLESTLGHPTQVNAYITPPGSRGLAVHSDSHDVFVLQSFGRKQWEVHEPGADGAGAASPLIQAELAPGHSLYMPRGTPHGARTQEGVSGHITVGVLSTPWRSVLRGAVERLLADQRFDEPLPPGFHLDPEGFGDALADHWEELRRWLDKTDPREEAEQVLRRFLSRRPPLLPGALSDILLVKQLDDSSSVRRRQGSICVLKETEAALSVLLGDRELQMPGWVAPAMRWIAAANGFRVGQLEEFLDLESRLVLVRRLVLEGLLEVPPGQDAGDG